MTVITTCIYWCLEYYYNIQYDGLLIKHVLFYLFAVVCFRFSFFENMSSEVMQSLVMLLINVLKPHRIPDTAREKSIH